LSYFKLWHCRRYEKTQNSKLKTQNSKLKIMKAAIFDVDGVLVDSPHEQAWREAFTNMLRGEWRDLLLAQHYQPADYSTDMYQAHVAGKPRIEGATAALAYFGVPDPLGERALRYGEVKQRMLLELVERGEFRAFDDALRLVQRYKAAGLRLAVASSSKNAGLFLRRVRIDDTTLDEWFDVDVCGREFPRGKPDPAIFLAAAAELRLPPQECLVVEDAPAGIMAAKAGGMYAIGIARLDDEQLLRDAGADEVVTNLDDLVFQGG
jgi:beta-phosphoglucomutase